MSSTHSNEPSDSVFGEGDGLLDQILDRMRNGEIPDEASLREEFPSLADEIPQLIQLVGFVHGASQDLHPFHDVDGQLAMGIPVEVGGYVLEKLISRGGMGAVYKAHDPALDRSVAVKFLESRGVHGHERFQREARHASKLNHAHIVPIYSVGEHEGVPYYAMRFIAGPSLASIARERNKVQQGLNETFIRQVAGWTRDLADALCHAHEHGVIHRDLKPSNILIDPSGRAQLADFGLARGDADATLTQPGKLIGTLRYMSPEQARGGGVLDERTDVYSLGATLYELIAGRPLFVTEEREAMLNQVLIQEPKYLGKVSPACPPDLATITHKALAKHRENRYQSAALFAQDLTRFLEHRPIQARPPTLREHYKGLDRRNKMWVRIALIGILLILGLAGTAATQAFRITQDRDRIAEESERAQQAKAFLVGVLFTANPKSSNGVGDLEGMLDAVAHGLGTEFQEDPATEADLHYRLGDVYWTRSRLRKADEQFKLAIESGRAAYGSGSEWVTDCAVLRASLLNFLGEHADAMSMLDYAQNNTEGVQDQIFYLQTRAKTLAGLGRIIEAKETMAKVLDSPTNQPGTLQAASRLEELGSFFAELGDFDLALEPQGQALRIFAKRKGESAYETSLARCKLASLLAASATQESKIKAEALLSDAVAHLASQKIVPVTDLAWAKGLLARAKGRLGKAEEADTLFQDVIATLKSQLSDHVLVAEAMHSYGRFLTTEDRLPEAIDNLTRSHALRKQLLGPNNARTLESLHSLDQAINRYTVSDTMPPGEGREVAGKGKRPGWGGVGAGAGPGFLAPPFICPPPAASCQTPYSGWRALICDRSRPTGVPLTLDKGLTVDPGVARP